MSIGQTYVIASRPYDGWAKIGRTAAGYDARLRLRALQTGNPRTLELRAIWPIDAEELLHRVYAEFRGSGEWFALPAAMLDHVDACATRNRPVVELLMEWPADRVWEAVGGRKTGLTPEAVAGLFRAESETDRPQTAHADAA